MIKYQSIPLTPRLVENGVTGAMLGRIDDLCRQTGTMAQDIATELDIDLTNASPEDIRSMRDRLGQQPVAWGYIVIATDLSWHGKLVEVDYLRSDAGREKMSQPSLVQAAKSRRYHLHHGWDGHGADRDLTISRAVKLPGGEVWSEAHGQLAKDAIERLDPSLRPLPAPPVHEIEIPDEEIA